MEYKRLPDRSEILIIKQIEIEGIVFDATDDLYNLLNELEDCDGFFTAVTIKKELKEKLEKLGIISQSSRGGCSPRNRRKLNEMKKIVLDVVYGK